MSTRPNSRDTESHEHYDVKEEFEDDVPVDIYSEDTFPDGGLRAWLVVCGVLSSNLATFGFAQTWGVFQAYYQQTLLKDSSPSNIAWIGSIQYAFMFTPGVLVGRLFDLGHFRLPYLVGSIGVVLTTLLTAECKQYWQFLLVQGVLLGVMAGICFGPLIPMLGHWFKRRRGLAVCCTALGGPIGGTIFPIVARQLIARLGFPWTMRIFALIMAGLLGVANITMRRRLPPKDIAGGLFHFSAFKSPAFSIYCLSTVVSYLGFYTLPTFLDISALDGGISPNFAFYLLAIVNAGSFFGRIATALMVDKIGPVNMSVPMTVMAALITYLWPLAHKEGPLVAIAAIFGFSSATWVTAFQLPAYALGDVEDAGRRVGMMMTIASLGALAGPPISGALNRATGGYAIPGYYAGSMMLLSCVLALITRYLVLKKLWGRF